jgi:DHA1 family inner membrane transport protein
VAAVTTVVLLAICLLSAHALPTVALVALLGLIGLSANPVLSSLAVRFAGVAPTLGVAMSVSAYNLGTAVGTVIAALTLVPTVAIALVHHRGPSVQATETWG